MKTCLNLCKSLFRIIVIGLFGFTLPHFLFAQTVSIDEYSELLFCVQNSKKAFPFFEIIDANQRIAATQEEIYIVSDEGIKLDTLDKQLLNSNYNYIQNIDMIDANTLSVSQVRDYYLFERNNDNFFELLRHYRRDKKIFPPAAVNYDRGIITKGGFLTISGFVRRSKNVEINYYPMYQLNEPTLIFSDKSKNKTNDVSATEVGFKKFTFIHGSKVYINLPRYNKLIIFDESTLITKIIKTPVTPKNSFNFLSLDKINERLYLVEEDINTSRYSVSHYSKDSVHQILEGLNIPFQYIYDQKIIYFGLIKEDNSSCILGKPLYRQKPTQILNEVIIDN